MTSKVLLALLCAACSSAAVADPVDPAARFERDMMIRFHMHENFGMVRAIERLLLRGKLDAARDLARAISIAPDEAGMTAWAAQTARVRDEAGALASAKTVDEAFASEAKLAQACSSCHAASGAAPDFARPPKPPPDHPTIAARMARHLWASDRLWEGVIGMADDAWQQGIDVLVATPLPATELGVDREVLARRLQRQAEQARKSVDDRAARYGEMLATCAACHLTPVKPGP